MPVLLTLLYLVYSYLSTFPPVVSNFVLNELLELGALELGAHQTIPVYAQESQLILPEQKLFG